MLNIPFIMQEIQGQWETLEKKQMLQEHAPQSEFFLLPAYQQQNNLQKETKLLHPAWTSARTN